MLEQVADAFKRKDYQTAARLLQELVQQQPKSPWVQFYVGRLHEETDKLDAAESVYRALLRGTTNPKIVTQARQGLQRIEDLAKERHRQALAQATGDPGDAELGVLILEPVKSELKQQAAQKLARIVQIDPYTARLHLPSRGWRLYRIGAVGEMRFYTNQLQLAEIPCFAASVADIEKINVFGVNYFQSAAPQASVVCQNPLNQLGWLTFDWLEVSQRVFGMLPIFEKVVDFDARHKLQRKTKILDYVKFCDLHLHGRGSILRLCDRTYQFHQGIALSQPTENGRLGHTPSLPSATARNNWNNLLNFLNQQLPQTPAWCDFTTFAESALDRTELLKRLKSHIELLRRTDSLWDPAFQLYSGLVFRRSAFQQ